MPFKTRYGSHYHMIPGCHGADIPCDAKGLVPCSDCCSPGHGKASPAGGRAAGGVVPAGVGASPDSAGQSPEMAPPPGNGGASVDGRSPRPPAKGRRRRRRRIPNAAGCVYTGYFVDQRQVDGLLVELDRQGARKGAGTLDRRVPVPHVTLSYMPDDAREGLFGAGADIRVVAYGNDGRNEGILVEVSGEGDADVAELTKKVAVPHITLSVAEGARPVDTAKLDFVPLAEPVSLHGTYGGCRGGTDVVLEPMRLDIPEPPGRGVRPTDPARGGKGDAPTVSYEDATTPMENPEIPADGLVGDVPRLAEQIAASDGALLVMRGSAGCGKSSVLSAVGLGGDAATVVCPDDIRVRLFGLEEDAEGNLSIPQRDGGRVWGIAAREAAKACAAPGKPVVIDAMHTRPRDIRQWQVLAERTGRRLVVVDLTDVPRDVARQRNADRVGWKRVPEHVIDRFYDAARQNTRAIRQEFPCVDRQGLAELMRILSEGQNQ